MESIQKEIDINKQVFVLHNLLKVLYENYDMIPDDIQTKLKELVDITEWYPNSDKSLNPNGLDILDYNLLMRIDYDPNTHIRKSE